MDKSWMDKARNTQSYIDGVTKFIEFAFTHSARGNAILCPCKRCLNCCWCEASVVYEDLLCYGFISRYKIWIYHGEAPSSLASDSDYDAVELDDVQEENDIDNYDEILEMIQDMEHQIGDLSDSGGGEDPTHQDVEPGSVDPLLEKKKKHDADAFRQFIADDSEELYPGCTTFSKLRFVIRLLHTKSLGGWSDKRFDMMLELLKEAFPAAKLPKNFYEAKKMIKCLELGYIKIHACENNCILFWKEHADKHICPTCKTSRWKCEMNSLDGKRVHKVPRKVAVEQKIQFWTTLKLYYVVDDKLKDWVMGSAAKKWRDFKSELKTLYFYENMTDEELQVVPDNRVSPEDWKELVDFWKSEAEKKRSQQGQKNRKEMELLHTSGSKSHARVSHEMHKKNGYPPHRHEVFMETHKCKKTGAPSSVAAANMFKKDRTYGE